MRCERPARGGARPSPSRGAGGSSGSALQGALAAAKELKPGQRCVVLLPDSVRNYMTKFLSDDWMRENGFLPGGKPALAPAAPAKAPEMVDRFRGATVADLKLPQPVTISPEETVSRAVAIMQEKGVRRPGRSAGPKSVAAEARARGVQALTSCPSSRAAGRSAW